MQEVLYTEKLKNMNFNRFRIKVLFWFLIIFIFGFLSMYIAITTIHWKVSVWLIIPVIISIVSLLRLFETTKRDLYDFLLEITHGDLTKTYNSQGKDDELKNVFEKIMKVVKGLRYEKEKNHQYLQTIVEHVNIALLCFNENDEIVLINPTFKKLINRSILNDTEMLSKINFELFKVCKSLESGQKSLIKLEQNGQLKNLSVQATKFKIGETKYKLISLQDINIELEEQEQASWKKLVRVLTHEIMNTAIPISTLSNVINEMFVDENGVEKLWKDFNQQDQENIKHSLITIEKRSKGIVDFVRATKNYTNIAKPNFELISANELIKSVLALYKPEFDDKNIMLTIKLLRDDRQIKADQNLLEQVIINIIRNSIEAMNDSINPEIKIELKITEENRTQVLIKDNGKGMSGSVLENIFVPFYTTKKEGSGIGLSLSKQIMQMHGGNVYVSSKIETGTTITLVF